MAFGFFDPQVNGVPLVEYLYGDRSHPAFRYQKGSQLTALPLLTEIHAMQKHGKSADEWALISRHHRAMMTAAVVIDQAFEAIRAYDNRPKKK